MLLGEDGQTSGGCTASLNTCDHMIISYESPSYSKCKFNWKWKISKTIAVPVVPDMSKEALEFSDESYRIKSLF